MDCPFCQQQIRETAKFCTKCGRAIPRCPTCHRVITVRVRHCVYDGTPIPEELVQGLPAAAGTAAAQSADATVRLSPDSGSGRRFCRKCGKPCEPGQSLCPACLQAQTAAPQPPQKPKKSILPILLVILAVLALLGVGLFVVFHVLPQRDSQNQNSPDAESSVVTVEGYEEQDSDTEQDGGQLKPTTEDETDSSGGDADSSAAGEAADTDAETPVTSAYADDHSYYGNSFENISQSGMMVSSGDWIYYLACNDDNSIWKMKQDGSDATQVTATGAMHMSIRNGWLYYRRASDGALCRFDLEGETEEVLVNRNIYEPKVVGQYIYFEDASDGSYDLYRIGVDGSGETKITDGVVFYCCVTDERIFYLDTSVQRKGYSVDLDGNDKQLWFAGQVGTIDYWNGTIYFTDYENGGLYTLDPDTGETALVSSVSMRAMNLYDGWVYFGDIDNNGYLSKMNLSDPTEVVVLAQVECDLINVSGGWVRYHLRDSEDDTDFYRISINGGEAELF